MSLTPKAYPLDLFQQHYHKFIIIPSSHFGHNHPQVNSITSAHHNFYNKQGTWLIASIIPITNTHTV